jgi:hypothetical protein
MMERALHSAGPPPDPMRTGTSRIAHSKFSCLFSIPTSNVRQASVVIEPQLFKVQKTIMNTALRPLRIRLNY